MFSFLFLFVFFFFNVRNELGVITIFGKIQPEFCFNFNDSNGEGKKTKEIR